VDCQPHKFYLEIYIEAQNQQVGDLRRSLSSHLIFFHISADTRSANMKVSGVFRPLPYLLKSFVPQG